MYLIDTNVISEFRKGENINTGVKSFLKQVKNEKSKLYLSVISIGELRRGVELIRHRGDLKQAKSLELWLNVLLDEYANNILDFTATEAQIWGKLRVPKYENALDKQIAATALVYDLTVVTRNVKDFENLGVQLINPFD